MKKSIALGITLTGIGAALFGAFSLYKLTKEEQTTLYNFKDNSFIQNINIKLTITSEDIK